MGTIEATPSVPVPVPVPTTSSSFTERACSDESNQIGVLGKTYTDTDTDRDRDRKTDTDMYDVHLYKQVLSGKRINPIIEMGNGPK